jgi:hypothetical protein
LWPIAFFGASERIGSSGAHAATDLAQRLATGTRPGSVAQGQGVCFSMRILRQIPLARQYSGYHSNRVVLEFTMLNQNKVIQCTISTGAMDCLDGRRDVKPDRRVEQFIRLRDLIEERASRKFFEERTQTDRPLILRSNNF